MPAGCFFALLAFPSWSGFLYKISPMGSTILHLMELIGRQWQFGLSCLAIYCVLHRITLHPWELCREEAKTTKGRTQLWLAFNCFTSRSDKVQSRPYFRWLAGAQHRSVY
ncbi:hypothetical protein BO86DRAFT_247099 [Aspergillus japonicus CBS 114.51]|uniref:Uncharacterized protein n=1 Tax=Aspergillus japonicus CBS 114.51 TaxID=1448312 RepID=A0A8T8WM96_ASPJA|nr:hypothetical protein BO86DRAFT_247099 [Aspergillus japonicus CBS 114.51]RAH76680.1 hypothetical protein BO86DRAFT_247099 [Aspergillus japonicus CBS 114.51]